MDHNSDYRQKHACAEVGGFSETCRGVSVSVSTLWCSGMVTDNRQEGEGDISIPA